MTCREDGCQNKPRSRGYCRAHAASRQCSIDGCTVRAHSRTLCNTHYSQHRKAGTLDRFPNARELAKATPSVTRPRPAKRRLWSAGECQEQGCSVPPIARNLCGKHYQQHKVADTLPPRIRVKLDGIECAIKGCERPAHAKGRCQAHASLHRRYGLTNAQMNELPVACEACACDERLHVDHDHATEVYRGVLCASCNTALGLLAESQDRITGLLQYLIRHQDGVPQ